MLDDGQVEETGDKEFKPDHTLFKFHGLSLSSFGDFVSPTESVIQ